MTRAVIALRDRLNHEDGFTLTELLVSVFLFAILTTILVTTVLTSANNFRVVRQTTDLNEESRLVLNRISRELRQAARITSVTNPDYSDASNVSITFEVDFNQNGIIEPGAVDAERLTYTYDRSDPSDKRILLQTSAASLPILASNVETFKLTYTSSNYLCDANSDGTVTWIEVDSAASPCPAAVGDSDSVLDVELSSIDAVTIDLVVLTGVRKQEYRTKIDLRNRV